jgi:ABC-type branched-subunit amino acid transport system substrate-binding protein
MKGEPALQLQAQLLEAGIGPQSSTLIVQNHAGLNSEQFWQEVPNGVGTVALRVGAWHSTLTEQGHTFALKYDQYVGRWPEAYAFASYDAVWLLADALRAAPTWQGADLVAELESIQATLTSGNIAFTSLASTSGDASTPPYLWHQWPDSQILYLQYTEQGQAASDMAIIWPPHFRAPTLQTAIAPTAP